MVSTDHFKNVQLSGHLCRERLRTPRYDQPRRRSQRAQPIEQTLTLGHIGDRERFDLPRLAVV